MKSVALLIVVFTPPEHQSTMVLSWTPRGIASPAGPVKVPVKIRITAEMIGKHTKATIGDTLFFNNKYIIEHISNNATKTTIWYPP